MSSLIVAVSKSHNRIYKPSPYLEAFTRYIPEAFPLQLRHQYHHRKALSSGPHQAARGLHLTSPFPLFLPEEWYLNFKSFPSMCLSHMQNTKCRLMFVISYSANIFKTELGDGQNFTSGGSDNVSLPLLRLS